MTYDYTKWIDRLLSCEKEPPEAFKELCLREAAEFCTVSNPRWVQDPQDGWWLLTADRMPEPATLHGEVCRNLFEGLYKGYVLALGPTKPWYVDAPKIRWSKHSYSDISQYEVPVVGKVERHWFATDDEARAFAKAESDKYRDRSRALWDLRYSVGVDAPKWTLDLEAKYDSTRAMHF